MQMPKKQCVLGTAVLNWNTHDLHTLLCFDCMGLERVLFLHGEGTSAAEFEKLLPLVQKTSVCHEIRKVQEILKENISSSSATNIANISVCFPSLLFCLCEYAFMYTCTSFIFKLDLECSLDIFFLSLLKSTLLTGCSSTLIH